MGLLGMGCGHAVRGRWLRGLAWVLGSMIAILLTPVLGTKAFVLMALARTGEAVDAAAMRSPKAGLPSWGLVVVSWLLLILLGSGISWLARTYYLESFSAPTSSMLPTIQPGDKFYISKLGYKPARGDVVVFISPMSEKSYVKRIVALGGDTVALEDGRLVLNGKKVEGEGQPCGPELICFEGQLDQKTYRAATDAPGRTPPSQPFAQVKVPPGHVFVLGDNRNNSADSRVWGPVPEEKVLGRADFIWYSSGPEKIRWERIDMKIR